MNDLKCFGGDLMLIFRFIRRLVEEAEVVDMDEGQLMVCPPQLLTKTAAFEYRSKSSRTRARGLYSWSKAV